MMQPVENFQIEDIDGCEFIHSNAVGKAIISYEYSFFGVRMKSIRVVYPDGSKNLYGTNEAQERLDSGEWTVLRDADLQNQRDVKSILY